MLSSVGMKLELRAYVLLGACLRKKYVGGRSVGTSRPSRLLAAPGPGGVARLFVLIQSLWFTFVFVRFGVWTL
jgi:hypothetical protein